MPELTREDVRIQRRSTLLWALALLATIVMYLVFYPPIRDSGDAYEKAIESLPPALKQLAGGETGGGIASPIGYLQGQFYATFGFILLLVFTVGRGSRAIAGDEGNGLLELILSGPVTRSRLVLERVASLVIQTLFLGVVMFVALLLLGPAFGLGSIGAGHLAAATLMMVLGGLIFGFVALAVGAVTGSHSAATGIGAAIASAAFLYTTLSPLVSSLSDQQGWSPCWQAFGAVPLEHGLNLGHVAVLLGELAVVLGVALWGFARRDVH